MHQSRQISPLLRIVFVTLLVPISSLRPTASYADTITVSGNITANTVWMTGNLYVIQNHVTINSGVTLTVQPGVIIKFAANKLLGVNGVLKVQGTITNPVTMTSIKDDTIGGDTNGDGNTTAPAAGDWGHIAFFDPSVDSENLIENAIIRYGGRFAAYEYEYYGCWYCVYPSVIRFNAASPMIRNTTITQNRGYALTADINSYPALSGNTLTSNNGNGLEIQGGALASDVPVTRRWSNTDTAYAVNGHVTVNSGVTLILDPGITVKFGANKLLGVNGVLKVQGTITNPVTITSIKDDTVNGDTNGDANATAPTAGDWGHIAFLNPSVDSDNLIENAIIRYGGRFAAYEYEYYGCWYCVFLGAVRFFGASPTVRSTIVTQNRGYALSADINSYPVLANNTLALNNGNGLEIHGGVLASDVPITRRWSNTDTAYAVNSHVTVNSGVTLIFDPGITVKFAPNQLLAVKGVLKVQGTITNPVTITSIKDDAVGGDTNGDGNATTPSVADWGHISFLDTSVDRDNLIENAIIRYGGRFAAYEYEYYGCWYCVYLGAVHFYGASPTVRNTTITQNRGYALTADINSYPVLSNNTLIANNGNGLEIQGGTLASDVPVTRRWSNTDTAYAMTNNTTVNSGVTLAIDPGVAIKFVPNVAMSINGVLKIQGTKDNPTILTSIRDDTVKGDTNGDGNASAPARGDWRYVTFLNTSVDSDNIIENAVIRYGGQGNVGAVRFDSASPTIRNNVLALNQRGLVTLNGAQPVLLNNQIFANQDFGLRNEDTTITITAQNNWWGHPSGPFHTDTNPDGLGDRVSNNVIYDPWLVVSSGFRQPLPLTQGQVLTGFAKLNDYIDYSVPTIPGQAMIIEVTPQSNSDELWLFGRMSEEPLWTRYDLRTQDKTVRGTYELLVSPDQIGTFYISVFGRAVPSLGSRFQITVKNANQYLSDVTPRSVGNAGSVTLKLLGLGFVNGMSVKLKRSGQADLNADNVVAASPTGLFVRFNLRGVAIGSYDLVAQWPNGQQSSVVGLVNIKPGIGGRLDVRFVTPEAVRGGRQYVLWVEYANSGDADLSTNLLQVTAQSAELKFPDQTEFKGSSVQFYAPSLGSTTAFLAPGSRNRIPIAFRTANNATRVVFSVNRLDALSAEQNEMEVIVSQNAVEASDAIIVENAQTEIASSGSQIDLADTSTASDEIVAHSALNAANLLDIDYLTFLKKPFKSQHGSFSVFDHDEADGVMTFLGINKNVNYKDHRGIDYDLQPDEEVLAAAPGKVVAVTQWNDGCKRDKPDVFKINPRGGTQVVAIDHDLNNDGIVDLRTRYLHLNEFRVTTGTFVKAGDVIGLAGNTGEVFSCPTNENDKTTGTHLHFDVSINPPEKRPSNAGNFIDPFGWWGTTTTDPFDPNHFVLSKWLWSSSAAVDNLDASFDWYGAGWTKSDDNYSAMVSTSPSSWAVWGIKAPQGGTYRLEVFIPDVAGKELGKGLYDVFVPSRDSRGLAKKLFANPTEINQKDQRGKWAVLGGNTNFQLERGEVILVKLDTPNASNAIVTIADKVRLIETAYQQTPVGTPQTTPVIGAIDPNDKVGPSGSGANRVISNTNTVEYTINFENLAAATAPVQELVVIDNLDPSLDWTSVQFSEIAYGDRLIVISGDGQDVSRRDLPAGMSIVGTTTGSMAIDMTAKIDLSNGRIEWRLKAIDTATSQPPEDPFAGFLPPENGTGRGQGHVTFLIKPKATTAIGTRITNKASITFDTNNPIATNEVWNTIGIPNRKVYLPHIRR